MATKFGLPGGIPERKVRPIWDAIDSRQYKIALKHCTSLLSKYSNSPYGLALKALILERMGKLEEALSTCLNAKELLYANDSFFMDDLTLSTLQIVFQRLDRLDLATSCYEYACGKFPNNKDLMTGLFNCYVREYLYVKQQQTAIKLYKLFGEERFLLWAVCSIQLQVCCGNGEEKLLALAEGLLKKHIASHSLDEPEALIVYISILELQGKYGDALEILSGKLGSLIMIEVDRLHMQGTTVRPMQETGKIFHLLKLYTIKTFLMYSLFIVYSIILAFCVNCLSSSLMPHLPQFLNLYGKSLATAWFLADICVSGICFHILSVPVFLSFLIFDLSWQGRLLARSGDNASAAITFQKILQSCPDDWGYFLQYLGCLLEDDRSSYSGPVNEPIHIPKSVDHASSVSDEMFESRILGASAFVNKLQTEGSSDFARGPYLASIEIERRKLLHGRGDKEKFVDALVQYFLRFGHLACFCSDIEEFLEILTPKEKLLLLEKFTESSASMSMTPTKCLAQSTTLHKLHDRIGNNYELSVAELEELAVKMVDLYSGSLPLSKDLDPQENMHGEELLSVATSVLVRLFWRTRHIGYLLEAVMMLELGLTIRRYVWQYKILLLELYSYLGALPVAYQWYRTLDVKNILLESLYHHILPAMLMSPLWIDLNDVFKDYLKFMDDHFRESADHTFLAYRHRNYSKVIEFVQFKEQLHHSNQYLSAKLESTILQLKEKADNIEEEEGVFKSIKCGTQVLGLGSAAACTSVTFNEEMELRPWWTPTPDKNYLSGPFEELPYCPREKLEECRKDWEVHAVKIIQKRSLIPRMIYLSLQCVSSSLKENAEPNGSEPDCSCSSELKYLLERYTEILGLSLDDAVQILIEVSKGLKCIEDFGPNLIDWMNLAVFYNAWTVGCHVPVLPGSEENTSGWDIVNSVLEKCAAQKVKITGPLDCSPGADLPSLVQLISEPVAWHGLILQCCVRSSVPGGKKKKKSGPVDQSSSLLSHPVRVSVLSLYKTVEIVIRWLKEQISRTEDEAMDELLSSLQTCPSEGPGKVFQVIKDLMSNSNNDELGDRISQAIKSWNPTDITRKMVNGQRKVLTDFLRICNSKMKLLETLKQ